MPMPTSAVISCLHDSPLISFALPPRGCTCGPHPLISPNFSFLIFFIFLPFMFKIYDYSLKYYYHLLTIYHTHATTYLR